MLDDLTILPIPQETCLKCNGCCRFAKQDSAWSPSLFEEEAKTLVKKGVASLFINPSYKFRLMPDNGNGNFICPFLLSRDNRCKIYCSRPFECRLYPFLVNKKDEKVFLAADLNCPFAKEKSGTKEFKDYIKYLISFLSAPDIKKLFKNNPHIIQEYPDVLNICEIDL